MNVVELTNNNKLNSSSIVHNEKVLSEVLNNKIDKEDVWFRKSKNLLNPNNMVAGYINNSGNVEKNFYYNEKSSYFIEINNDKNHTFSIKDCTLPDGVQKWVAFAIYDKDCNFIERKSMYDVDSITYTSDELSNAKYVRVSTRVYDENIKLQLEENSVATEHESYAEDEIFVKSNKEWREFDLKEKKKYLTIEQKIGTWIDGKTLYRRVLVLGALHDSGIKQYIFTTQNMEFITHYYGSAIRTSSTMSLNTVRPSTGIANGIGCWIDHTSTTITVSVDVGTGSRTDFTGFVVIEYTKTTD